MFVCIVSHIKEVSDEPMYFLALPYRYWHDFSAKSYMFTTFLTCIRGEGQKIAWKKVRCIHVSNPQPPVNESDVDATGRATLPY